MSPAQQRALALWAMLLTGIVCLGFLPVSRLIAMLLMGVAWMVTAVAWSVTRRRTEPMETVLSDTLPDATWRQPVVLVCGDILQNWPGDSAVLKGTQGCWIRVEDHQDVTQITRQLLALRPHWGRQLSVMVSVSPQQHRDTDALTRRLLALRWQISQLQRITGHRVPLILTGLAGSEMMSGMHWQAALPGENTRVWRENAAPCSVACWVSAGGAMALQQQLLINSLISWFHQTVTPVFIDQNPDIPVLIPAAILWGVGPSLEGAQSSSLWTSWLQRHTALNDVAGWHPLSTGSVAQPCLPEFVLSLLPEGQGLTPGQRAGRCGLMIFTLAAIAALCSSGWNNRQLLQRLTFDINHYNLIAMDDYAPKAEAVKVLRQDAAELDEHARNGEPWRVSLGLYQGAHLRLPVLEAIRSYLPPLKPELKSQPQPHPQPKTVAKIIRLDSLSLFDSGKAALKAGSTRVLVNALVGIRAKPGWLIVVSGHTDNTGNPKLNQRLSRGRAESVRDWMRDTGDVPESCFAVQGYGASRPIATNDTPEGRALNRRVEISLVPQADACQLPGESPATGLSVLPK